MKKLPLLLIVFLMFGCVTIPIQNPVCPQEGSWICTKSAELGYEPEQVYGWIYNAAAIGALTDIVKIQELCEFEQKIADWYLEFYPFSYDALIDQMLSQTLKYDTKKMLLIKNMLNKNFIMYRSPAIITPPDDIIFKKGHAQFRRDMLCY